MEKQTHIYRLLDPRFSGILAVKYVGKTHQRIQDRLRQHVKESRSRRKRYKVNLWIVELLTQNLRPIIELVETVETGWRLAEKKWIDYCLSTGATLCNLQDGGLGPSGHVQETRERLSLAHKGRVRSLESRMRQSAAQAGRVVSEETRLKISEKLKGHEMSIETRNKISAQNKGRRHGPCPDHVKAAISIANKGRVRTDEQRAALSIALRGRKMPPRTKEHMAKISAALKRRRLGSCSS